MKPSKQLWKNIILPTLSLSLLCLLVTFAIVGTHALTANRIEKQHQLLLHQSLEQLIPANQYETLHFNEEENYTIFVALTDDGTILGHLFLTSTFGYSGDVQVLTAIVDGTIKAIDVVDASGETPGLGQNIREESFTKLFKNLNVPPTLTRGEPTQEGEIQAITGATISADAVVQSVARAMELYEAYIALRHCEEHSDEAIHKNTLHLST